MFEAFFDRPFTPGEVFFLGFAAFTFEAFGNLEQAVGGIIAPVQDNVFYPVAYTPLTLPTNRDVQTSEDAQPFTNQTQTLQS